MKIKNSNELPIWILALLKCRNCKVFKKSGAFFYEDDFGNIRLKCEKLGDLRVNEWINKISNCLHFEALLGFLFLL